MKEEQRLFLERSWNLFQYHWSQEIQRLKEVSRKG